MTITAHPQTATRPATTLTPLDLTDAFCAALHVGDTVTALFRGPELMHVLVSASVVGRTVSGVLLDPVREAPNLLDGTTVTPGEFLTCAPAECVLDDRTARGDTETLGSTIGHRDATGEALADGDTVAFPLGASLGSLHWARGQVVAYTDKMLFVRADGDYRSSHFDPFITAGEEIRVWAPRSVRVGSPA